MHLSALDNNLALATENLFSLVFRRLSLSDFKRVLGGEQRWGAALHNGEIGGGGAVLEDEESVAKTVRG